MTPSDRMTAETTILTLAKRRYIYKSEITALRLTLTDPTVTVAELETLLYSLIDVSVLYIDDETKPSQAYEPAAKLRMSLRRQGIGTLCAYFNIPENSTYAELVQVYDQLLREELPMPLLEKIGEVLREPREYEKYRLFEEAERIWDELEEAYAEEMTVPGAEELRELAYDLADRLELGAEEARAFLESGIRELGIPLPTREPQREALLQPEEEKNAIPDRDPGRRE